MFVVYEPGFLVVTWRQQRIYFYYSSSFTCCHTCCFGVFAIWHVLFRIKKPGKENRVLCRNCGDLFCPAPYLFLTFLSESDRKWMNSAWLWKISSAWKGEHVSFTNSRWLAVQMKADEHDPFVCHTQSNSQVAKKNLADCAQPSETKPSGHPSCPDLSLAPKNTVMRCHWVCLSPSKTHLTTRCVSALWTANWNPMATFLVKLEKLWNSLQQLPLTGQVGWVGQMSQNPASRKHWLGFNQLSSGVKTVLDIFCILITNKTLNFLICEPLCKHTFLAKKHERGSCCKSDTVARRNGQTWETGGIQVN